MNFTSGGVQELGFIIIIGVGGYVGVDQPTGMGIKVDLSMGMKLGLSLGLSLGMNVGLSMGLNIEMWQVARMQQPTLPPGGYNLMMGSGGYTL